MKKRRQPKLLCASFAAATLFTCSPSVYAQQPPFAAPDFGSPDGLKAPDSRERDVPFAHLFETALNDFRHLPSRDTMTWLGIGAAAAAATRASDGQVTRELSTSAALGETLKAGQLLGGAAMQHGGAFATYLIGRATHSPKITMVGADLLRAHLVAQTLTEAVKIGVSRTRPDGTGYSFPSGHTSVTFATATVLQRDLGWKVGVPAYGLATYVAASRIQVKRHFLSDVAFGAALGIMAGRTVTVGRAEKRFAVGPMMLPGGGGIAFDWIGSGRQSGANGAPRSLAR